MAHLPVANDLMLAEATNGSRSRRLRSVNALQREA